MDKLEQRLTDIVLKEAQAKVEVVAEILLWDCTCTDYWDCECPNNYIHNNSEPLCDKCGAEKDEQPESRFGEVLVWKRRNK